MKKTHFLQDGKPICGVKKTLQDSASVLWFSHMKHKCKTCDNILNKIKSDFLNYEYYEKPTGKWRPCNMDISAFKMQGIEIRFKN